ncbi:hypothetical protein BU17DRAFT_70390 [Hysterangium stoloniferum]|nr:hypothetical protein BU17DRAFT_70390 [Hysterangium stoloniferum]
MQSPRQHHMQLSEWIGPSSVCQPSESSGQDSYSTWFGSIDTADSYVGVNYALDVPQYSPTAGYLGFSTQATPSNWSSCVADTTALNQDVPRVTSVPDSADLFATLTSIPTTKDRYTMSEYGSSINLCLDRSPNNNTWVPHAYSHTGRNTAHKKLAHYMQVINLKGHVFYQCTHPLCKTKPSSWTRKGIMVHLRRQHIPEFEKPFICTKPGCCKKFERGDACKEHQILKLGQFFGRYVEILPNFGGEFLNWGVMRVVRRSTDDSHQAA